MDLDHEAQVSGKWLPCEVLSWERRRVYVRVPGLAYKGKVTPPAGGIVVVRRAAQVRPRARRGRGGGAARPQQHDA